MQGQILSEYEVKRAISPVAVSDDTATSGEIIDLAGYAGIEFFLAIGTLADANATFAVILQHGATANLADAATVTAAGGLIGANPDFQFDDDDKVKRVGYAGTKRYIRIVVTPTGNTGSASFSAVAVLKDKAV
jgi:hypothetical protein